MKRLLSSVLVCAAMLAVGCSSSGGGGAAAPTGGGVDPSSVKAADYPNVEGQLLGNWMLTGVTRTNNKTGRQVNLSLELFINANETAAVMVCTDVNSQVIAKIAGKTPSTVNTTSLTLKNAIKITSSDQDCGSLNLNAGAFAYTLDTQDDTVSFDTGSEPMKFQRVAQQSQSVPNHSNTSPGSGSPGGFPGSGSPGGNPGGMPSMQGFVNKQCSGASVTIDPSNCSAVKGRLVQSVNVNGQCMDLPQPMDAAQICSGG